MDVKSVVSRPEVTANEGRMALQRGPLVYCVESTDNNGHAWNLLLPQNAKLSTSQQTVLTEPVISIETEVPVLSVAADGTNVQTQTKKITAIPY